MCRLQCAVKALDHLTTRSPLRSMCSAPVTMASFLKQSSERYPEELLSPPNLSKAKQYISDCG